MTRNILGEWKMLRRTGQKSTLENLLVNPECKTEPYEEPDQEMWVKCAQEYGRMKFLKTCIAVVVIVAILLTIAFFIPVLTPFAKGLIVVVGLGILIYSGVKNIAIAGAAARNEWKDFAAELDTQFYKKTGSHLNDFEGDERKKKWVEAVKYLEERSELEKKETFELNKAQMGATRVNVTQQSGYGRPRSQSTQTSVAQGFLSPLASNLGSSVASALFQKPT